MTSPSSALAWQIWRLHRGRLLAIFIAIAAFALFYPKFCSLMGLNLGGSSSLDAFASSFTQKMQRTSPLLRVIDVVVMIFLLLGPFGCMVVSLAYVIWIFTFAEGDPAKVFSFPARLFRLPISTGFLAAWPMLAGAVTLTLVFLGWTQLVQQPPIDVFDGYPNLLVWLTLLVLAQACIWALDGFPIARVLLLSAAVFFLGYLAGPAAHPVLVQHRTAILLSLIAAGSFTAPIGLKKIRHGNWQRLPWPRRRPGPAVPQLTRLTLFAAPAHFSSASRAQLWLEWRRHGRKLCLYVAALSSAGLLTMTIVALVNGGLSDGETQGLTVYLLAMPLFVHFCQGIGPERTLPQFLTTQPVADGDIATAKLKSAALSAIISWLITAAMLAIVPLLGDIRSAFAQTDFIPQNAPLLLHLSPMLLLGAIVLTWRFVAVNVCLGTAGKSSLARVAPVFMVYGAMALIGLICYLARNPDFERTLFRTLPFALGALLLLKILVAGWFCRACLKRHLLPASAIAKYLVVWLVLALSFTIPAFVIFHDQQWLASLLPGILLLLPLARIALSPLCLGLQRHQ
jgi:hypothetical protein